MYLFNGYVFDSNRLLIYDANTDSKVIDKIKLAYDEEHPEICPQDLRINSDDMHMDNIAIDAAGICLSSNCNLRCRYCGYSSDEQNANKLQLDDVKVFINDIIMRRTIKKIITKENAPLELEFTGGGEPTYDWGLFEESINYIKQICAENNIPVLFRLTTNGMLTDTQRNFISHNFDHVMISYDGLPEIQNKNRVSPYRGETNTIVEASIRYLATCGVPLTVRSTIWQDDFDMMMEMYHHVFSIVPHESKVIWSIYPVMYEGRAVTHFKQQEDTAYGNFFLNCMRLIDHIISEEGEERLQAIGIPLFDTNLCSVFCGAHKLNKLWLMPDKSITTCIESKDHKVLIGKIYGGDVHYYESYQDNLLKIVQKKYVECRDCIAYSTCRGGCPIWHLRVDDNMQEPLECCLQKEYWTYIVKALIEGKYSFGWGLKQIIFSDIEDVKVFKVYKENKISRS